MSPSTTLFAQHAYATNQTQIMRTNCDIRHPVSTYDHAKLTATRGVSCSSLAPATATTSAFSICAACCIASSVAVASATTAPICTQGVYGVRRDEAYYGSDEAY